MNSLLGLLILPALAFGNSGDIAQIRLGNGSQLEIREMNHSTHQLKNWCAQADESILAMNPSGEVLSKRRYGMLAAVSYCLFAYTTAPGSASIKVEGEASDDKRDWAFQYQGSGAGLPDLLIEIVEDVSRIPAMSAAGTFHPPKKSR